MDKKQKPIIIGTFIAVAVLAIVAVAIALIPLLTNPGVKTEQVDTSNAQPASTDIDGEWSVTYGKAPNISSAGFTFHEVLPGDKRITSGSTRSVSGNVSVKNSHLTSGTVTIDMADIHTDNQKRDTNVRSKIFETAKYPEASYEISQEVDLSAVPSDGISIELKIPGKLTIHGVTRDVTPDFTIIRDGNTVKVSTTIPINRLDFNVHTPEFVAAKIDENGEINVLLNLEKSGS